MFPTNPYIVDTTLRDGEQAPGVVFSLDEKIGIAALLEKVGIPELEVGVPSMGKTEFEEVKTICNYGFDFKTTAWCRATIEDISIAAKTNATAVNVSFPVSDVQLQAIGKDRNWVMKNMKEILDFANDSFTYVAVGAQDASRADKTFLFEFADAVQGSGAHRIRIADTVGILNPVSTEKLISYVRACVPTLEIEFHPHNDLGMATANAISAYMAGANAVSCTVNGLGERAGNAALEEIILGLEKSLEYKTGYTIKHLTELSHYVEKASNRPLSMDKPITGRMILTHETGIHTRSILANNKAYELIDASEIGRQAEFVYGKFSGKASIQYLFEKKGIKLCNEGITKILQELKAISTLNKRSFSETEVLEMFISAVR
ncbi:MAG: pyruvate carboxyltransferase [Bacteroidales bacterium]|nr:pyruvate carboxyltransferase [Bacteroidales bacterium]